MKEFFNAVIAVLGTGLTYIIGGWDTVILVLVVMMALDYLTGVMGGFANKNLSSAIGFRGLLKKVTILIVLIVAVMLDRLLNAGSWVFRTLVAYFYICNEAVSLLENSAKIGVPIPRKLINVLEQLKKKNEEGE